MDILPLALGLLASALLVVLSVARGQRAISLASIALSTVLIGQYLALEQPLAAALSGLSLLYGSLVLLALHRGGKLQQLLDSTRGRLGLLAAYSLLYAALNGGIALDLNLLAYLGSTLMVAVLMVDSLSCCYALLASAGRSSSSRQEPTVTSSVSSSTSEGSAGRAGSSGRKVALLWT